MNLLRKELKWLPVFACLLLATCLEGQSRFNAGFVGGLNVSQIEGDESAGYNKIGLHGGLRVATTLGDKSELTLEMLYAQRGSYLKGGISTAGDLKINLKYAEVPVLFTYKDWLSENEEYYRIQGSIGLSYGRLFSASAEGSFHDEEVEHFNENDLSFTVGAEYFTNQHFSIGVRWTRSLNLLYNHKNNFNLDSLRGYFLSFRATYLFGSGKRRATSLG